MRNLAHSNAYFFYFGFTYFGKAYLRLTDRDIHVEI